MSEIVNENQQQSAAETQIAAFNLQDVLWECLRRWWWFVISIILCMGYAYFYILKTQPVYTATASILVKDKKTSGNTPASAGDAFSELGIFSTNTNILNEMATIKSPALVQEVVSRLDLDVNYTTEGRVRTVTLYGKDTPVDVQFPVEDGFNPAGLACAFDVVLHPGGSFTLRDFKGPSSFEYPEKIDVPALSDSIIRTPVGPVIVEPGPAYSDKLDRDYLIHVYKSTIPGTTARYTAALNVALADKQSSIINLSINDVSIPRAENFLSTLITVYNENWVKDRNQIAVSTSMFIDDRLRVIADELGNVDSNISSYKSEHLLPDVGAAAGIALNQVSEATKTIQDLSNQIYMAKYIRNYLANDANRNELLPVASGVDGLNIANQVTQYNTLLMDRNSLVSASSESNPLVIEMDAQAAALRSAMISAIDNELVSLNARVKTAQGISGQATSQIASNPKQAKDLLNVERQQKVKESLYLYLLQKREENELSQAFSAYNTRVIQAPIGNRTPTLPVKRNIYAIAMLVALAVPFGLVSLKEMLNNVVRGRRDIEVLSMPFAGEIPQRGKLPSRYAYIAKDVINKINPKKHKRKTEQDGDPKEAIVVKAHKRDVLNEAFRVVRSNIEFMLGDPEDSTSRTIALTSANPGSGKTFISYNLGKALSLKNKKVVCVDLDLRKASLSRFVDKPKKGVADYLAGRLDIDSIFCHVPGELGSPGFDIIPVGTMPPNPTELLYSRRMHELMDKLKAEYDYIILDCPPIEIVADASIINKYVDLTLFVIRAGVFERAMLPEVEKIYKSGRYKNVALILNGTESAHRGYRYGYHYGYHYGYGSYGYGYGHYYGSDDDSDDASDDAKE